VFSPVGLRVQRNNKYSWNTTLIYWKPNCSFTFCQVLKPEGGLMTEICALLGYYSVPDGNSVSTFRDNLSVPFSKVKKSDFLTIEIGADRLSRNVSTELPFNAACYPRRSQISFASRRKPEMTASYVTKHVATLRCLINMCCVWRIFISSFVSPLTRSHSFAAFYFWAKELPVQLDIQACLMLVRGTFRDGITRTVTSVIPAPLAKDS
jgi:hypothetical protein